MSTHRVAWQCCGSVSETEAWEPDRCPFCDTSKLDAATAAERERCAQIAEELDYWPDRPIANKIRYGK